MFATASLRLRRLRLASLRITRSFISGYARVLKVLEAAHRWRHFYVSDEAEYYEAMDASRIIKNMRQLTG